MPFSSREWQLAARPMGEPTPADFAYTTVTVPDPGPGQIVVRNTWLSVDPYMRGRMNEGPSYIPQFELGETMTGSAVGVVVASETEAIPVGTPVSHFAGWREYALLDAAAAQTLDTTLAPAQAYLGVLGTTGLTAYAGVTDTAPVTDGDVVFVSGAAGAVGSVAGQIARKLGAAKVIGSAGGRRRPAAWSRTSASMPRSTTARATCPRSSPRPPPKASTSTSTTSAATTSRPPSAQ